MGTATRRISNRHAQATLMPAFSTCSEARTPLGLRGACMAALATYLFLGSCAPDRGGDASSASTTSSATSTAAAATSAASADTTPAATPLTDEQRLLDLSPEDLTRMLQSPPGPGRVRLVNVWATWCAPCIKEFPYLVMLAETYGDRLDVVFISADFPEDRERALDFLSEQRVDWPTFLKTGRDVAFIQALSEGWSGAIPFTLIQRPDGTVSAEWSGEADLERFESEVVAAGLARASEAAEAP